MPSLFKFKVVDRSNDNYYVTRWDSAIPVSVIADSKTEATAMIWPLMGESPNGRYWTAQLQSVEPVPPETTKPKE